ncbi:head-tail connector protein [Aestuariivita boseongensis]|uniref:head-tail connector protein n=1 Tax=Aestuariivita boseongensis TaxID=1470562 RepID=UPI0006837B09|nr:hypothetical protein [Aestuariivita boseongensis]
MMLIEENAIPDAALPVDAFKAHLRLGTGFAAETLQDGVLRSFLRAAIAAIEARTGKALIARTFSLVLSGWQNAMSQAFPVAPVVSVTDVALVDRLGQESVVPADQYWLEQDMHRPRLKPRGMLLPTVAEDGSARITFVAGYAADFDGVPSDLAQAVLLLASHYYEFRHETALPSGCMPFGVSSLIERYRSLRLRAGRD